MHAFIYARRRRNLAILTLRIMTINFFGFSYAIFIFFTFSHLLFFTSFGFLNFCILFVCFSVLFMKGVQFCTKIYVHFVLFSKMQNELALMKIFKKIQKFHDIFFYLKWEILQDFHEKKFQFVWKFENLFIEPVSTIQLSFHRGFFCKKCT